MSEQEVLDYYKNKLELEKVCYEQTKDVIGGEIALGNEKRKEEIARLEIVVAALQKKEE